MEACASEADCGQRESETAQQPWDRSSEYGRPTPIVSGAPWADSGEGSAACSTTTREEETERRPGALTDSRDTFR